MTKENNGLVDFNNDERYRDFKQNPSNICNYQHDALKGNLSNNPVATLFFSNQNIKALQVGIQNMVMNKTCGRLRVGNQSVDELLTIMRGIYLEHSKNSILDIVRQVKDMNGMVLSFAVPRIIEEVDMHNSYIERITKLPVPLELAQNDSIKGSKTLYRSEL